MGREGELGLSGDGTFIHWYKFMELVGRVESPTALGPGSIATAAIVQGIDFTKVFVPFMGKKVKIIIEVQNET